MNDIQPKSEFALTMSFCSVWPMVGGLLAGALPSITNPTLKTALTALIAAANSVCSSASVSSDYTSPSEAGTRLAKFGLHTSQDKVQFLASLSDYELATLAGIQRSAQQSGASTADDVGTYVF